jgi:hypothetical protein
MPMSSKASGSFEHGREGSFVLQHSGIGLPE